MSEIARVGGHLGRFLGIASVLPLAACTAPLAGSSVDALATSLTSARQVVPVASTEELRRLQVREFGVSKETAFASTINALLDLGYRIESADLASGLIVAKSVSNERLRLDLSGLLNEREISVISAFVESRGEEASRVRISMVMESVSRANSGAMVRGVQVAEPYEAVFAQLTRETADRSLDLSRLRPLEAPPQPPVKPAPLPAEDPTPTE